MLTALPDGVGIANQSTPACNTQSKRGSQISGEKSQNPAEAESSTKLSQEGAQKWKRFPSPPVLYQLYRRGVPTGVRDKVEWDDPPSLWKEGINAGRNTP